MHAVSHRCAQRYAFLHGILKMIDETQSMLKITVLKYPIKDEESPSDDDEDDYRDQYCSNCIVKDDLVIELREKLRSALEDEDMKTEELDKAVRIYVTSFCCFYPPYTPIYTHIHPYTPLYTPIHPYTPLYTPTALYSPIYPYTPPYTPIYCKILFLLTSVCCVYPS